MTIPKVQTFKPGGVQEPGKNDQNGRPEGIGYGGSNPRAEALPGIYRKGEDESGGNGHQQGGSDEWLAAQIAGANSEKVKAWANRLSRSQQPMRIPAGSPLAYIGPNAKAVTLEMGSTFDVGMRREFGNAPWRGGGDGNNLTTSGRKVELNGPAFNVAGTFNPNAPDNDIPDDWAGQMAAELHRSRVNQDHQFNLQLLAAGRYSMIAA